MRSCRIAVTPKRHPWAEVPITPTSFRNRGRQRHRLRDGRLLARGDTPIFLAERELGRTIGGDASTTLAGLLMESLDRIPQPGDVVERGGVRIQVLRASGATVEALELAVANETEP